MLASDDDPMLQPGAEAPNFDLKVLDTENNLNLDSLLTDCDKTFVTFWTTHCPDCLASLANMHNLPEVFDSLQWNMSVASINFDRDEWDFVREFFETEKISFPVLVDKKGKIAYKYGADVYNISFFIIDKDKKILWTFPDHPKKPKKALETIVNSIKTKLFPDEASGADSTKIDDDSTTAPESPEVEEDDE